jgi:hypothetical protein
VVEAAGERKSSRLVAAAAGASSFSLLFPASLTNCLSEIESKALHESASSEPAKESPQASPPKKKKGKKGKGKGKCKGKGKGKGKKKKQADNEEDDKEEDDEAPEEVKDGVVGNGAAPEPNAQDSRETRSKAKAAAAQSSVAAQEVTIAASIERDTAIDLVRKTESKKVAAEIMSHLKSCSYHDLRAKASALGLIEDSRRVSTASLALSCDSISLVIHAWQ